jgi:hypothetical protein
MIRIQRLACRFLAAAGTILMLASSALAQQQLGAIQGTITDQTRSVLPGATVTITNLATGVSRTTVSNEVGVYRVASLDPGAYELTVELDGFRPVKQPQVTVSVGATVGLDFQLQAGAIAETILVTGHAPDIQTEKADVSAVVEQKKVVDLPLLGRNPLALASLQPGVAGIPRTTDLFVTEQGLGINANGQRESGNNAIVDGVTISGGPWGGTVLIVPNVEAVQEFQIIANNASAEFGRNAGAAVSIITKGGTNQVSGTGFEFLRNQNLRSRNIFEPVDRPKPDFERNDFGFSIGGPIRRDRAFYFLSYDGVRETGGQGAIYTVETEQLKNWVLANRPNSRAAQLMRSFAPPMYPAEVLRDLGSPALGANVTGPADGIPDIGSLSLTLTSRRKGDQGIGRADQVFRSGNDRIRGSYYANRIETQSLYVRPQFDHPFNYLNQFFGSNYTRVISNQTMNEVSFGWVRQHGETGDPTPEAPTIGITGLSAQSGFGVDFWHPITFTQNNFELPVHEHSRLRRRRAVFRNASGRSGDRTQDRGARHLHHQ